MTFASSNVYEHTKIITNIKRILRISGVYTWLRGKMYLPGKCLMRKRQEECF